MRDINEIIKSWKPEAGETIINRISGETSEVFSVGKRANAETLFIQRGYYNGTPLLYEEPKSKFFPINKIYEIVKMEVLTYD